MKLEKQRFDERVHIALQQTRIDLEKDLNWSSEVGNLMSPSIQETVKKSRKFQRELEYLDSVIQTNLQRKNITVDFDFALTKNFGEIIYYQSDDFPVGNFQFDYYNLFLGGKVSAAAHGQRILHLEVNNLFGYLLTEMYYLLIPSIVFLLLLSLCFWVLDKMLQQEEALNNIKNDFINNLTHELKTPSFAIELASDLGIKKASSNTQEYFKIIQKENKKLQLHIDQVLELASLEQANYPLRLERVEMIGWLKKLIEEYTVDIKFFYPKLPDDQSKIYVKIDQTHFKNTLNNLIENAVKYNNKKPEIFIHLSKQNKKVAIAIKDNGIGIDKKYMDRIFNKFYRITDGDLAGVKGYGLGLHYVKMIVTAHGGKIALSSEKNGGSTFSIQLPESA